MTQLQNLMVALDNVAAYVDELPAVDEAMITLAGFTPTKTGDSKAVIPGNPEIGSIAKKGKGVLGAMVSDTGSFSQNLNSTMSNLQRSSKSIEQVTEQLQCILKDIENGKGSAGKVLKDTVLANHLARSIEYIDSSAFKFNENMEALKSNFLLRRYFKKKK